MPVPAKKKTKRKRTLEEWLGDVNKRQKWLNAELSKNQDKANLIKARIEMREDKKFERIRKLKEKLARLQKQEK